MYISKIICKIFKSKFASQIVVYRTPNMYLVIHYLQNIQNRTHQIMKLLLQLWVLLLWNSITCIATNAILYSLWLPLLNLMKLSNSSNGYASANIPPIIHFPNAIWRQSFLICYDSQMYQGFNMIPRLFVCFSHMTNIVILVLIYCPSILSLFFYCSFTILQLLFLILLCLQRE